MIAVVAAFAWVIVMVLRHGMHEHSHPIAGPASAAPEVVRSTPQDILAERLARGEIEPEEYSKRLAALLASPPPR
ncbi:MAG: SHOCT domain-containing protein [Ilumatobacteraceae bacterium]